jgi:hypothetical protein
MNTKGLEGLKTANEIPMQSEKEEADYISYDAPPLDFSYKNIKHLSCKPLFIQNSVSFSPDRVKKVHNLQNKPRARSKSKKKKKKSKEAKVKVRTSTKVTRKRTRSSDFFLKIMSTTLFPPLSLLQR